MSLRGLLLRKAEKWSWSEYEGLLAKPKWALHFAPLPFPPLFAFRAQGFQAHQVQNSLCIS